MSHGELVLEQLLRIREAAGGQHDPAQGPDGHLVAVLAGDDTGHRSVVVRNQPFDQRVVLHLRTPLERGLGDVVKDHPTAAPAARLLVLHLRDVGPGGGRDEVVERPGVLASRVHQPVIERDFPGRYLPEAGLERDPARHQPVEVLHAVLAVDRGSDPRPHPAPWPPSGT